MKHLIKFISCLGIITLAIIIMVLFNPKKEGAVDLSQKDVLYFAHRGDITHCPENTLCAIKSCIDKGAKGVEIDITLTKDDSLIVCHDENAIGTLGVNKPFTDFTYQELQKYPILYDGEKTNEYIPTLNEVYDLVGDSVYLYLDLKLSNTKMADEVLKILRKRNVQKQTLIADGNVFILRYIKRRMPEASTVLEGFSAGKEWTYDLLLGNLKPDYFSGMYKKCSPSFIHWLKKKKLMDKYIIYHIISPDDEQAYEKGIKYMIIDKKI